MLVEGVSILVWISIANAARLAKRRCKVKECRGMRHPEKIIVPSLAVGKQSPFTPPSHTHRKKGKVSSSSRTTAVGGVGHKFLPHRLVD